MRISRATPTRHHLLDSWQTKENVFFLQEQSLTKPLTFILLANTKWKSVIDVLYLLKKSNKGEMGNLRSR